MRFHPKAIEKAHWRQIDRDRSVLQCQCARCGRYIEYWKTEGINWYAIPRIPIEQGGKKANNCIIVCPDCYIEIGQDGTKIIPYSMLLYFRGSN